MSKRMRMRLGLCVACVYVLLGSVSSAQGITAVVHVPTGEFVTTGLVPGDATYAAVAVPHNPDPRTEKWNGTAIVAKSAAETAAYDAGRVRATADAEIDGNTLTADLITSMLRHWPAIQAEITAGTYQEAQWRLRILATARQLRRARKGV